jgi:hypothetical protein
MPETKTEKLQTLSNSERLAKAELDAALEVRRQRSVSDPGEIVVLPGGKAINAREYIEARPAFKNRGDALVQFEKILKKYEPDKYVYAWPLADDPETQARIRAGLYQPLGKDDLNAAGDLVTHEGTDDRVWWYRHILVRIPKQYADEMYEEPKARALKRLVHQENWFRSEGERVGHAVGAQITVEKQYGR